MSEKPCGINCPANCCDPVIAELPLHIGEMIAGVLINPETLAKIVDIVAQSKLNERKIRQIMADGVMAKIRGSIKESERMRPADGGETPLALRGIVFATRKDFIKANIMDEISPAKSDMSYSRRPQEFISDIVGATKGRVLYILRCGWFNKDKRICGQYENRPQICRDLVCGLGLTEAYMKLRKLIERTKGTQADLMDYFGDRFGDGINGLVSAINTGDDSLLL